MRHAYKSDATATAPPLSEANDQGFPTDGDQSQGIQPTVIGTYWAHAVSSEIINAIEAAGLTPSGNNLGQFSASIGTRVTTAVNAISGPTPPDFASRNEHIQTTPPDDEFANPRDARFAIRSYLAARA